VVPYLHTNFNNQRHSLFSDDRKFRNFAVLTTERYPLSHKLSLIKTGAVIRVAVNLVL
jgi:hypothetical protein